MIKVNVNHYSHLKIYIKKSFIFVRGGGLVFMLTLEGEGVVSKTIFISKQEMGENCTTNRGKRLHNASIRLISVKYYLLCEQIILDRIDN